MLSGSSEKAAIAWFSFLFKMELTVVPLQKLQIPGFAQSSLCLSKAAYTPREASLKIYSSADATAEVSFGLMTPIC